MTELLFNYELRITGKVKAVTGIAAEQKLRAFISMPLSMQDDVESVVITVHPDFDATDMERRFRGASRPPED